jgi:hypothetical protein
MRFLVALAFTCLPLFAQAMSIDEIAKRYVALVLAVGEHDEAYVDAYYGPAATREAVRKEALSLAQIRTEAEKLRSLLPGDAQEKDELVKLRIRYLSTQLSAIAAFAGFKTDGEKRDFDKEAKALYDTAPPVESFSGFDKVLDELEALVPGDGALDQRLEAFFKRYEIPEDKLPAVFDAAIQECRSRTGKFIQLPASENFTLEYVKNKPWSGYNWYKGKLQSLIQINTDLPVRIDRAIDLGCHEGYPGHHTYNALLEQTLVRDRGWPEYTVYPLFSPQSLIAEGTANYGIELAFPGSEKVRFEQKVLYPLAGLNPDNAVLYEQVQQLASRLSFARNQIARLYLNGEIDRQKAIGLSCKYGLSSEKRAEQSVRFIETYGAYVINYNWGKKLVADYIEANAETQDQRWQLFKALISSPRLPSGLY